MNTKQITKTVTFDILDGMANGEEFKTINLRSRVNGITGKQTFDSTITRYIREYSAWHRPIINISKAKSIYKVVG